MEVFLFTVFGLLILVAIFSSAKSRLDVEQASTSLSSAQKQASISPDEPAVFRFNCFASFRRRQSGHFTEARNFGQVQVLVYEKCLLLVGVGAWRSIRRDAISRVRFFVPDEPDVPQLLNLNGAAILANAIARAEAKKIPLNFVLELQITTDPHDDSFFTLDRFQASFDPMALAEYLEAQVVRST